MGAYRWNILSTIRGYYSLLFVSLASFLSILLGICKKPAPGLNPEEYNWTYWIGGQLYYFSFNALSPHIHFFVLYPCPNFLFRLKLYFLEEILIFLNFRHPNFNSPKLLPPKNARTTPINRHLYSTLSRLLLLLLMLAKN